MAGRARLYEALAAGDAAAVAAVAGELGDPLLLGTAAWYLRFELDALDRAVPVAEEAVRRTAGLVHAYRDTLAAVRIGQGRPREALDLLDPHRVLPAKRPVGSGYHYLFLAQAFQAQGEVLQARHSLELGLAEDRRLVPHARSLPEFAAFADIFTQLDQEFFDQIFAVGEE
jgi:hypothetical protein